MIEFFNPEVIGKSITDFNDIVKYILHPKTTGFICNTQFEADMFNYIIKNESYGEVEKPGTYWWVNDEEGYINEEDLYNRWEANLCRDKTIANQ